MVSAAPQASGSTASSVTQLIHFAARVREQLWMRPERLFFASEVEEIHLQPAPVHGATPPHGAPAFAAQPSTNAQASASQGSLAE